MFGSLFFLFFLGLGLVFLFLVGREFFRGLETRRWSGVECVILVSEVREDGQRSNPYRFHVRYQYEWGGHTFTSERWARTGGAFSDYAKALRLVELHRVDTKSICYVNPHDPSEALLERPSLWIGAFIFVPLIFVGIGGLGVVSFWWRHPTALQFQLSRTRPLSSVRPSLNGFRIQLVFCSLFLVIGCVILFFVFIRPVLSVLAARSWPETTCRILSSRVVSGSGNRGNTYRVDVLYAYEVNGREFRSNRYQFMPGSSSGSKGKYEVTARYRPGTTAVCYVNPTDPTEAVLERGMTQDMWFGLLPGLFVVGGGVGVIGTIRRRNANAASAAPGVVTVAVGRAAAPAPVPIREIVGSVPPFTAAVASAALEDPNAPLQLKSSGSRWGAFVILGLMAIVWNCFMFFVLRHHTPFSRGGRADAFSWLLTLFALPFVLVGVGLLAMVLYQFLGMFNPKPELTIQPGVPRLGSGFDLSWRLSGRTEVLRSLTLSLEGREEATHRQGTRTLTDRKAFFTVELLKAATLGEMMAGQTRVTLPAGTVPSFKSENNRIVWAVRVHGSIPRWPDLKEEFEIHVQPAAKEAAA